MSLGVVVKGPEGLVLAAESRVTLTAQPDGPNGQALHVNFDHATKVLSFGAPNLAVAAVTYGQAAIGLRSAHSFVPEFESTLPDKRLPVQEFADRMSDFFVGQMAAAHPKGYAGPDMTFVVAGFDENQPYGRVFCFHVPRLPKPIPQQPKSDDFGISWGGQREFVDRLLQGYDHRLLDALASDLKLDDAKKVQLAKTLAPLQMPIPLAAMALQDCVDLAMFFIRTTISAQRLTVGIRGCGGEIDVATITRRENFRWVQQKQVTGTRNGVI